MPRKNKVPKEIQKPYRSTDQQGFSLPVNSRSLDSFVQRDSLKTTREYDWKKGEFVSGKASIIKSAREDAMTLRHRPVASGRNLRKGDEDSDNMACSPSGFWPKYK